MNKLTFTMMSKGHNNQVDKRSRMSVLCLGWECMGHGKRAKDEHGGKNKVVGRSQILGHL